MQRERVDSSIWIEETGAAKGSTRCIKKVSDCGFKRVINRLRGEMNNNIDHYHQWQKCRKYQLDYFNPMFIFIESDTLYRDFRQLSYSTRINITEQ